MSFHRVIRPLTTAALGLWVGVGVCAAQEDTAALHRQIAALQTQNKQLETALTEANRAEKEASEQLAQVRTRLEALGKDLLDGGDERLIQAMGDIQVLNDRVSQLEASAVGLSGAVQDFISQAVASDPQARLRLEASMRELDSVLGLMQKPAPTAQKSGSARQATIMSIDSESGLLVFNIGEQQGTRIGTTYRLYRGEQPYGTAIITDVRRNIAGAFVETLEGDQGPVRLGDKALLETE